MYMSRARLEGPKSGLRSVVSTSIDVISESWSSLGFLIASVVLGWVKRALKPYRERSSPTQPIYHSYHSSQQTAMTSRSSQLFADGYLPVMPKLELARDRKYQQLASTCKGLWAKGF